MNTSRLDTRQHRAKGVIGRLFALCAPKVCFVLIGLVAGSFAESFAEEVVALDGACPNLSQDQLRGLKALPVKTVVDGDTLRLQDGQLVRFIGVNTPEIDHEVKANSQPLAIVVRTHLQQKLKSQGNRVLLLDGQQAVDRYNRRLAHVYTMDGQSLEHWLLEQGYGFHIAVPPDLANLSCYATAQARAQQHKRGVWGHDFYKVRDIAGLTSRDTGFVRIRARISRVGRSKRNIWLNLVPEKNSGISPASKVAIQISRKDLTYFNVDNWRSLQGRTLVASGWLSWRQRQQELVMRVRHPLAITVEE